jgi:ubiquinone/menaquinone biosynthesis C-methylase UbiE
LEFSRELRKIRKDWDRYAEVHNDLFASVGRLPNLGQLRIGLEDIVKKLLLEPSNELLEIGCGTGLLLSSLSPRVSSSIGIDFSIKNIDIARQHFPEISFVVGDVMGLPFAEESFDRILTYSVFHYTNNIKGAVEETLRVCKGGGVILIGDLPDVRQKWHLYFHYIKSFLEISRSPLGLWKKLRERIYGVNWYWVDVEALRDEIKLMGHEAEILAPPEHAQFGCKAYLTRADLRITKKISR